MDGNRFDTMVRGLAGQRTRRQALSGLLGAAALAGGSLVGLGVAEAKRGGNGKAKGKGNGGNGGGNGHGKGKGRKKISFCHKADDNSFVFITVGEPARKAHRKHGDTECAADECNKLAGTCSDTGDCELTPANEGEPCGADGTCTGGVCVV